MSKENSSLTNKIMGKIERKKLSPRNSSYFIKKKVVQWSTIAITIFLSGHSLGVLFYFFSDFDYDLLPLFLKTPNKTAILIVITIWFSILLGASIWAFKKYRSTQQGYKLRNLSLTLLLILATVLIGVLSYKTESSIFLDKSFNKFIPYYQSWESVKIKIWSQPGKGLLSGKITEFTSHEELRIQDMTGRLWSINIKDSKIRDKVQLKLGQTIKLIGHVTAQEFLAREIRPWHGHKQHYKSCLSSSDKQHCIRNK